MPNPYFGNGKPVFIIAEIGANHNGDIDLCLKTMDAAVECGASAIKLQLYTAAELVADTERVWGWGPEGNQVHEPVGAMFDRLSLSHEEFARAYAHADQLGVPLFATPFSVNGVGILEDVGNPIYKIASSDLSYYPLLDAIEKTGKPLIISTGKSPLQDVFDALAHVASLDPLDVAVLHCIAQYPAPIDQMNMRVITTFRALFPNHPTGLSDHCVNHDPALASVALGGCIIEKHFTLGHDLYGPDHWFSMDPPQLKDLVSRVRDLEQSLGDGQKGVAECEEWEAMYSRRSIIVMRDLAAGQIVSAEDLAMLRPGTGLHPRHWDSVVGRKTRAAIPARTPLDWQHLEAPSGVHG
jgi:sialic acid synthase SpsE